MQAYRGFESHPLRLSTVRNPAWLHGLRAVDVHTAADTGGVPGTFTERFRETWDAKVAATSLKVELKAGTSVPEFGAGSVYWDNARVATNCR